MKESRFSSVFYMWCSFGFALIATLMMFVPNFVAESQPYNIVTAFSSVWPSFIGYMLILVGGLLTAFLALPFVQPSYKMEKLILLCGIVLYCAGFALVISCVMWYCLFTYGSVDYMYHNGYYVQAGGYITAALVLIAIANNVRAILLDK